MYVYVYVTGRASTTTAYNDDDTHTVIHSFIHSFTWSQCVLLVNLMREGPRFTTPFHIEYKGNQV